MTRRNTLNVKFSNLQIKIWNKNGTEVTLKLASNVVGESNDENNMSHKML